MTTPRHSPARVLHFHEWMTKHYPKKTPSRQLLRITGVMDLLYVLYRMQAIVQTATAVPALHTARPAAKRQRVATVSKKPARVKKPKAIKAPPAPRVKKVKTPKAKPVKAVKVVKAEKAAPVLAEPAFELAAEPETVKAAPRPVTPAPEPEALVLEDMKPEPVKHRVRKAPVKKVPAPVPEELVLEDLPAETPRAEPAPEPAERPEPEPLVLEDIKPEPAIAGKTVWIDDASMEEADLLKSGHTLGTDGIHVELEKRDTDDGQETLVSVNGRAFRLKHSLLPVNLSAMLQTARVSYGELHVHGSAGIGGLSGKGYILSAELTRIAHILVETKESKPAIDVEFFSQDKSARSRTPGTIRIIFERVS